MAQGARNIQGGNGHGDGNEAIQWHKEQETYKVAEAMVNNTRINLGTNSESNARW